MRRLNARRRRTHLFTPSVSVIVIKVASTWARCESELRSAFAQIQRDLREQYLVAYSPSNKARDGSYRKIQIEVIDPELRKQKLKLNYRPGYFAKTADRELPARKRSTP